MTFTTTQATNPRFATALLALGARPDAREITQILARISAHRTGARALEAKAYAQLVGQAIGLATTLGHYEILATCEVTGFSPAKRIARKILSTTDPKAEHVCFALKICRHADIVEMAMKVLERDLRLLDRFDQETLLAVAGNRDGNRAIAKIAFERYLGTNPSMKTLVDIVCDAKRSDDLRDRVAVHLMYLEQATHESIEMLRRLRPHLGALAVNASRLRKRRISRSRLKLDVAQLIELELFDIQEDPRDFAEAMVMSELAKDELMMPVSAETLIECYPLVGLRLRSDIFYALRNDRRARERLLDAIEALDDDFLI